MVADPEPRRSQESTTPTKASLHYVVSRWGAPTQTFVRREASEVVAAGGQVSVLSLRAPLTEASSLPVTHLSAPRVLFGATRTLWRRPRTAAGLVLQIVGMASPRNLVRQLWACLVGLAWASRGDRCDLIHAHFGWVSATAAWALGRMTGTRYTVVLHAFELHDTRYLDRFTPVPLRGATHLFTISASDAALVEKRWGIHAEVLRMGVPDALLEKPQPMPDREPWLIVAVGSLVRKKGHDVLLAALARSDPRWRLVIAGEGPERRALEHEVRRLGLADRVQLRGHLGELEVESLVRRAAVCALACKEAPSGDRDGIPVALMEAMAMATPVVSSNIGGIPELVEDCGILVPPGDVAALARGSASSRIPDSGRAWRRPGTGASRRRSVPPRVASVSSPLPRALGRERPGEPQRRRCQAIDRASRP